MSELTQKVENNCSKGILCKYALVIADLNGLGSKAFTYSIPDDLKDKIKFGSPVVVPFGSQNAVNGFVVGFSDNILPGIKVKNIIDVLDDDVAFTPEYMQLLLWVAKYYVCDLNTVIQLASSSKLFGKYKTFITRISIALPSDLGQDEMKILSSLDFNQPVLASTLRKKACLSVDRYLSASRKLKTLQLIKSENILTNEKISQKTQKIVTFCSKNTKNNRFLKILEKLEAENSCELSLSDFLKIAKTTLPTLKKMQSENLLKISEIKIYRNPLNIFSGEKLSEFPDLSFEQEIAVNKILDKIEQKQTEPILLHGITASGKTEVYFSLIQKVIATGKNVLFLAPEIAVASMLTKRTALRFGLDNVAVWHSYISDGEKHDIRERLKNNEIKILVGARSAVFAPLKNIGLIIVDEEHEGSYKQTSQQPLYSAVEVAQKLAILNNASIVLGSATPDICTYYKAKMSENLVELKERYNNVPLAPVELVDMREEFSEKGQKRLSNYLINQIDKNLENNKQTILLMNRLGFSTKVQCPSCGEILKCPNCGIPLIFHKNQNLFKCHWCDFQQQVPDRCPKCSSADFKFTGIGTERVEEIASKLFPKARIKRFDSEVLKGKNSHHEILNEFQNGNIDILIGTQMSAKGLDNENVTLVGVINSDNSFVFPDFRSTERGFQLLTQVAGRAGRGQFGGKVIFQTYNPEFSAIQSAKEQDYTKFYEDEIKLRRDFVYPPFSQIARMVIFGSDEMRVFQSTTEIADKFNQIIRQKSLQDKIIIGQASPCAFEKINNDFRYEILIKNLATKLGHTLISKFYKSIKLPKDIKIRIDVSPMDLL